MLKKCRTILMVLFAFVFTAFVVTACSNGKNADMGLEYEYNYDEPLHAECDAFMTIDGVLDEEKWAEQNYLEWSSSGGVVKATTIFTNRGVYVGATAQTDKVIWTARHAYNKNTHFWIQLVKTDEVNYENYGGYDHPGRYLEYRIDAKNSLSYKERQYDAKGYFDGTLNSADSTVFSAELFVPWSEFGYSQEELDECGQPEAVKMLVHFRDPEKGINYPGFTDDGRYSTYYTYDEGGSNLHLDPSMSIGHAIGKESASDQWEIDDENKTARSTVDRLQVIWFREDTTGKRTSSATDCILETTIRKPEKIYGSSSPYVGFMVMENKQMFSILGVSLAKWGLYNEIYTIGGRSTDGGMWVGSIGFTKFAFTGYENETVRLKLVKRGGELFYFVNDVYQGTEYIDRVQGECEAGLYANGMIEFSDWAFTDYSGNQGALDDVLRGYLHFVTPSTIGSGDLNLSATRVKQGDSITVSVIPQAGNILKSFKINGEDKFGWFMENAENAQFVYTPSDDEGDIEIEAEFEKIKEETKSLYITLKDNKTDAVLQGSTYSITSGNNLFVYKGTANNKGLIITHLLPDGDYEAGGESISFSGTYHFVVDCPEYMRGEFDLTVKKDNLRDEDIEWKLVALPWGTVTVNGATLSSQDEAIYDSESGGLFSDGGIQYLKNISPESANQNVMDGFYVLNVDISVPEDLTGQNGQGNVVGVIIASGNKIEERIEFKAVEREKSKVCVRIGDVEIILTGFPTENEESNVGFTKAGAHWKIRIERRNDVLYVYNNTEQLGFTIDRTGIHLENSTTSSSEEKIKKFNGTAMYFFNAGRENALAIVNYVEQGGNYLFKLDCKKLESVTLTSEVEGQGEVVFSQSGEMVKDTEVQMSILPEFGWEIKSVTIGEQTYDSAEEVPSSLTVNANTVVRVVFIEMQNPQYTVVFHSGCDEDETVEQKIYSGVQTALQKVEFESPKGVLLGWTKEEGGEEIEISLNEEVTDLNNGKWTVDLYAVWGYAELEASYDVESTKTLEITAALVRLDEAQATFSWSASSSHFSLTGDTNQKSVTISGTSYAVGEVLTLTLNYGGEQFTYTANITVWAEGWDGFYQINDKEGLLAIPENITANYYLTQDIEFDMNLADGYSDDTERRNKTLELFKPTILGELAEGCIFDGNHKKISYSMFCKEYNDGNYTFIDFIRGTVRNLNVVAKIKNAFNNTWFANKVMRTGVIDGCDFDITLTANSDAIGNDIWQSALLRSSGAMKNSTLTLREEAPEKTKGTLLLSYRLADDNILGTYENVTVIADNVLENVTLANYMEGHGVVYDRELEGGGGNIYSSYEGVTVKGFPHITLEEAYSVEATKSLTIDAILSYIDDSENVTYEWSTEDSEHISLANTNQKTVTVNGLAYGIGVELKLKATYKEQVFDCTTKITVWAEGREGEYLIRSTEDLINLPKTLNGKFVLENDISFDMTLCEDADGTRTNALFNKTILGELTAGSEFDGKGYTISYSMFCNSGSANGNRAFIEAIRGTVKNLNVVAKIRNAYYNCWFANFVYGTGVIEGCNFDITLTANSNASNNMIWQNALMRNSGTMKNSTLIVRELGTQTKGTLLLSWRLADERVGTYEDVIVYADNVKADINNNNYEEGHGLLYNLPLSGSATIVASYEGVTVKSLSQLPGITLNDSYSAIEKQSVQIEAILNEIDDEGNVTYLWSTDSSKLQLSNTDKKSVTVEGNEYAIGEVLKLKATYRGTVYELETKVNVWAEGKEGYFLIHNEEELLKCAEQPLTGKYSLEADIDFDMTYAETSNQEASQTLFSKTDSVKTSATGSANIRSLLGTLTEGAEFNGNGHTISYSIYTASGQNYGLFGIIEGTVTNLSVVAKMRATDNNYMLAYMVRSTGKIEKCSFDYTLTKGSSAGANIQYLIAFTRMSGTMKSSTVIVRDENFTATKGALLLSNEQAFATDGTKQAMGTFQDVTVYADNMSEAECRDGNYENYGHYLTFERFDTGYLFAVEVSGVTVKTLNEIPNVLLAEKYYVEKNKTLQITPNFRNIDPKDFTFQWSSEGGNLTLTNEDTKTISVQVNGDVAEATLKLIATSQDGLLKFERETTVTLWNDGNGLKAIRTQEDLLALRSEASLTGTYVLLDDIKLDMTLCDASGAEGTIALFTNQKSILGTLAAGAEFNGNGHKISYSMLCNSGTNGEYAFIHEIGGTVKNLNIVARIRIAYNNAWFAYLVPTTGVIEGCNFDITLTSNADNMGSNCWQTGLMRNSGKMKDSTLILHEEETVSQNVGAKYTKGTVLLSWKLVEENKLGTYEGVTVYADNVNTNSDLSGSYEQAHVLVYDRQVSASTGTMYSTYKGVTVKSLSELPE